MLRWLLGPKITPPDGKYTFHYVPAPTAGTGELVFDREFADPIYPLVAGAGKVAQQYFHALQPPQVYQTLVRPVNGAGGIPAPNQTFDFAPLTEGGNG